jgi:hypothetical protein
MRQPVSINGICCQAQISFHPCRNNFATIENIGRFAVIAFEPDQPSDGAL